GRQTSFDAGTSRTYTPGASGSNFGKQRTVICYNCKGEGHISKQCTKPKRKRDDSWFKEKVLPVQAQSHGQILNEEELAFLADPDIPEDALVEVHNHDNMNNNVVNQAVQVMPSSQQSNVVNHSETKITSDNNVIPYSQTFKRKGIFITNRYSSKNDFKKEESRNINREIALEKQIKQLDNIIFKRDQSAQTVHMLTKPQFFYDNTTKQALGFQNPFYLQKAQQSKPKLYVGDIIVQTNPIVIPDSEETLALAEESRSKKVLKHKDNMMLENKKQVDTTPIDYAVLNQLYTDFPTRFVSQTELSAEQAFWSQTSVNSSEPTLSIRPTNVEVPKELPKVSMVNTSLKKLKHHLANFDVVVKERTTPTTITEGSWGFEHTKVCFRDEIILFVKALKDLFSTFNQYLVDELSEVQNVFYQMEQVVEQYRIESKTFENNSVNVHECQKCLKLETELQTDFVKRETYDKLFKSFTILEKHCISLEVLSFDQLFELNELKFQSQEKDTEKALAITALKDELRKLKGKALVDNNVSNHPSDPELHQVNVLLITPKLLNKRTAHSAYIKHSQEEAAILRDLVDHIKANYPLDPLLESACKYTKLIQEMLSKISKICPSINRVKLSTSASESQPSGNTKKDKIQQTQSRILENKCNGCMLSDNHDLCVLEFINNVNAHAKSRSVKKNSKREVWKPTGKVFTNIGYIWRPTFTIVGNACPLTRITITTEVPLRKSSALDNETPKPVITLVYSRKPRRSKTSVPVNNYKVVQIILWYLDSGCSKHMTGDRSQLTNFVNKFLATVKFGNDHVAKIMGYGDYQIGNVTISRVYYVEGLGHNLFFVGQFCDSNLEVTFRQHTCYIRNLEGVNLLTGSRGDNLYTLSLGDMMASSLICLLSKASKTKSWLWHRHLSHLNFGTINHLSKHGLVRGLLKLKFEKDHLCSACALGKSTKKPYKPKSEDTNQETLYLLHMDLCGLMCVVSVNEKKYILVIMIQVRLKETVRHIRTDNGTEFVNQTLRKYYEKVGISHETSVARSPQQNGVVERRNCTLIEAAHTMLIYAKALLFLWPEAVATACYTQNCSMIRLRHGKTPYELLHNKPPDLSYLHMFGALCYPTNDSENLGKLQPKVDIGIFNGYAPTKKAFRIYNRRTRRIIETILVDFDELTAMDFEHSSSGPALHEITPAIISSGLVPKPPPSTPFIPPSRTDWDILPKVIAPIDEVVAPEPVVSTSTPSSTTVDQDAPSPSNSQTTPETLPPVIPNDVEEDNHDIEVTHMGNDPYFGIQILEVYSDQSSSSDIIHIIVPPSHQVSEHNSKWTKDHPLENIIGELDRPVSTRLQLHEQALFCYYDAFLTVVEPKTYKDALT
ncbi:retrovirus-related pol polyprotein from transposon TNT 1-94, partial [Tanacetum coccineum]